MTRARTSGYRRTALVGVASATLLVATLGTASGQEDEPAAAAPFSNGTAKATAVVARVAPGVGALELGISAGVAVAEIKNTVGQAQSESLDLGLIGSLVNQPSCTGTDLPDVPLPEALRVDSRGGDTSMSEDDAPVDGASIGGARKYVEASTKPAAEAITTVAGVLGPVVTFNGGRAVASTEVLPGEARLADARVSVDLDIAGLVQLSGLRWSAFHRTGANPTADATFDLGTASLLGVPIPLDSLTAVETAINQLLAASGITITFPKIERFTTPSDLVRVTPLRIVLKDSPIGAQVLGPVLNLTREQRLQLFDEIAKLYCAAGGALLVGDIGLAVASGTGFLAVEIGGAEATTGELVLEDPFGDGEGLPIGEVLPELPLPLLPGPITAPPAVVQRPVADIGPLEEHCESAHPLRDTGCSKGALLAVGLIGAGATAAVGALDWRHQRRRRASAAADAS